MGSIRSIKIKKEEFIALLLSNRFIKINDVSTNDNQFDRSEIFNTVRNILRFKFFSKENIFSIEQKKKYNSVERYLYTHVSIPFSPHFHSTSQFFLRCASLLRPPGTNASGTLSMHSPVSGLEYAFGLHLRFVTSWHRAMHRGAR